MTFVTKIPKLQNWLKAWNFGLRLIDLFLLIKLNYRLIFLTQKRQSF